MFSSAKNSEAEDERQFFDEMKDFPCSFNLGYSKLDVENTKYTGPYNSVPELDRDTYKYMKKDLKDTDENNEDYEDPVWRDNLLTYLYAKLGKIQTALRLNDRTLAKLKNQNLVTLANAVFLHYQNNDSAEAEKGLSSLRTLKESPEFKDLKLQAIIEQAYEYRNFGGAKHLLCSIALLEFAFKLCPGNERVQFMQAVIYRRCTHIKMYAEDPKNIDRHQFAWQAANELFRLSKDAKEKSIKSGAFIELAYLKYNDERSSKFRNDKPLMGENQWSGIVGDRNWRQLCQQAIEVAGDKKTEKVLKIAGQLLQYSGNDDDFSTAEQFLKEAISIKPSNRAHHHLGLLYRKMAVTFEQKKSVSGFVGRSQGQFSNRGRGQRQSGNHGRGRRQVNCGVRGQNHQGRDQCQIWNKNESHRQLTESNGQVYHNGRDQQSSPPGASFCHIPSPPENKMPQTLEDRLKTLLKIPREKLKLFSQDNEHAFKAVEHLKQAVKLSHKQNVAAYYDLAMIYAQMEQFNESKQACQFIIKQSQDGKAACKYQIYLVNAYNLFGLCCTMEAKKAQEDNKKQDLMNKSEYMFVRAVREAASLAANVPELATAATDLWNAFKILQKKFEFEGSEDSQKKLFKLCEFIHDYRCLEVIGKVLSQDESAWENDEAMEHCLQRYLNLGDINRALLFYDMIPLRRGGNRGNLTCHASNTVCQLMTKVAECTLFQNQAFIVPPDPIWKRIFQENFSTNQSSQIYDIVIVRDVSEDVHEPRSENVARCLKKILKNKLGLNVVHSHKEGSAGKQDMPQQAETISKSHVAIFILSQQRHESDSLESHLSTSLTLDDGDSNLETAVLRHPQERRVALEKDEVEFFRFIINASIVSHTNKKNPGRILLLCFEDQQVKDLPLLFQGLPSINFSQADIGLLNSAMQGDTCDEMIDLVMKIFTKVINKNYHSE